MCTCVHLRVYTCTDTRTVCFASWDKGESSITSFIFLCLSDSLSSLPWLFLFVERLQCAHHIRNDVFLTVPTKDIACPPTLPPAALSQHSRTHYHPLPFTHVPPAPVLHPEHPSCPHAKRSTAAWIKIPGLAPSPPAPAFSGKGCLYISLLFLQSLPEPPERCHWMMLSFICCFFPWDPLLAGDPGDEGMSPTPEAVEQSGIGVSDQCGKRKLSPTG